MSRPTTPDLRDHTARRRSDDGAVGRAARGRYCRTREVVERLLGVSRVTLWQWRRHGLFPPAQRLGPNTIAWPEEVIDQWIASRPRA